MVEHRLLACRADGEPAVVAPLHGVEALGPLQVVKVEADLGDVIHRDKARQGGQDDHRIAHGHHSCRTGEALVIKGHGHQAQAAVELGKLQGDHRFALLVDTDQSREERHRLDEGLGGQGRRGVQGCIPAEVQLEQLSLAELE